MTVRSSGTIIKGVGGFYSVMDASGNLFTCRARGKFRYEKITPMPGDKVQFGIAQGGAQHAYIEEILQRKNVFVRPMAANIDVVLIVVAPQPQPDLLLVDKMVLQAQLQHVPVWLCFNKCDLDDGALYRQLAAGYTAAGCTCMQISARKKTGVAAVSALMQGQTVCLAGQSGVGKSSLINAIDGQFALQTDGLSARIGRGKNTTRHAQLHPIAGGMAVDTPGFSLLELPALLPEELQQCYVEFAPYFGQCRFLGCVHHKEPDCAIKAAVQAGEIDAGRYARYTIFYNELLDRRKHRYD